MLFILLPDRFPEALIRDTMYFCSCCVKQDFDANSIVSVKPAKTAEYDICIKVQDETGTIAKKYFTVNVIA